jgi:hypothetical protein
MPRRDRDGAWTRDHLEDAHGGRWTIDAWVVLRERRLVVGELRIYPAASAPEFAGQPWQGRATEVPPGGLERRTLRSVPVGRYAPVVEAWASQRATWPDFAPTASPRVDLSLLNLILPGLATIAARPRPRRAAGREDLYYAVLAQAYVDRLAARSLTPVRDIARRRGDRPAHIRDLLHEARERGLLSPARPGKREGHLLAPALALLRSTTTARRKKTTKKR